MRNFVRITALLAALLSCTGALAQQKIVVAHALASDFMTLFIGRDKGIFQKHGLNVEPQLYANIALTPAALMSNQIQIGAATPTNALAAAEAGLDVVAVLGGSRLQKKSPRVFFVSRPGLVLTRPEDLKGKRIGVPGFNAIIHLFTMKWLMNNKLSPKDVTFVEVLLPQMADFLKAGTVDVVTPIEPVASIASKVGNRSWDFYHDVNPDVLAAFWISSRSWADANRKTLVAFKAAMEESIAWIQKNPDEARQIEVKYFKLAAPTFPVFSTSITPRDLDAVADIMRELGQLKGKVDTARLIWK
jgi:NitT/TauT family transport system substrate-binding protein